MKIEDALALIEITEADYEITNRISGGLKILQKYGFDDSHCQYEHDVIYAVGFDIVEEMSRGDVRKLAKLGWFCDAENECWCHY